MDSRPETWLHIHEVQRRMNVAIANLAERAHVHDQSKLHPPELAAFDEATERLKDIEYGTPEYKASLDAIRPAIDHHQSHNSHHPEFYGDKGVAGMTLLDLVEMICDWSAASLRTKGGDLRKSIEYNQERFGYSDELAEILMNTAAELGLID